LHDGHSTHVDTEIMRLLVFGASGGLGRHLVAQAIAEGHTVRAFLRDIDA